MSKLVSVEVLNKKTMQKIIAGGGEEWMIGPRQRTTIKITEDELNTLKASRSSEFNFKVIN